MPRRCFKLAVVFVNPPVPNMAIASYGLLSMPSKSLLGVRRTLNADNALLLDYTLMTIQGIKSNVHMVQASVDDLSGIGGNVIGFSTSVSTSSRKDTRRLSNSLTEASVVTLRKGYSEGSYQ